jgi:hypothetical protein
MNILGYALRATAFMLKIGSVRWKGRCSKHPRYNPEIDGLGGIRGGCIRCEMLLEIYSHHASLVRLIRQFGSRPEASERRGSSPEHTRQMSLLDF